MYPHPQIWRPLALVSALVTATLFATATITVAPGDTLSEIAERHDISVEQLMEWNDIDDPDMIIAGATLVVSEPAAPEAPTAPHPGLHVVTAGDTLFAIAARFGTSVAKLVAANELDNPDRIFVGQELALSTSRPAATEVPAPARRYTVVAGDTLSAIAERHGVKTGVLAADNGIVDADRITVGTVLSIGEPASPAPVPPETVLPETVLPETVLPETVPPETVRPTPTSPTNARDADEVLLAPIFARWAELYDVPQDLLEAIAWKESTWTPDAVGPNGHLGIMQLSPETVSLIEGGLLGKELDPLAADDGIQMGARFLRYLLDRTDDQGEAVAAWVQGLRGVRTNGVNAAGERYVAAIEEIRRRRG